MRAEMAYFLDNRSENITNGAASQSERILQGSFFAVLVAVVVLITI